MRAIFFDLETSDQNFCGQILNYCFLETNEKLEILQELSGEIRLSRLQLPRAGAILANRVDVLEHQKRVQRTEAQAMQEIYSFIDRVCEAEKTRVALVGYNSQRFDVPFLRTSFIRNGFNPYFSGRLVYRDLFHLVQALSSRRSDFPRAEHPSKKKGRLSLKMETVSKELGALTGAQTHESRDDVELTIRLASALRERFDSDILSYESFEPHKAGVGDALEQLQPEYDLSTGEHFRANRLMLLNREKRSSLWLDLDRVDAGAEGRDCVRWFNENTSSFVAGKPLELESERKRSLLDAFAEFTPSNFFERSSCDIELDIYRLGFDPIEHLGRALRDETPEHVQELKKRSAEGYRLYLRSRLAREQWEETNQQQLSRMFKKYAHYRYGGEMQLSRSSDDESVQFHPSYQDLLSEIKELSREVKDDQESCALLESLQRYYNQSEVAGVFSS